MQIDLHSFYQNYPGQDVGVWHNDTEYWWPAAWRMEKEFLQQTRNINTVWFQSVTTKQIFSKILTIPVRVTYRMSTVSILWVKSVICVSLYNCYAYSPDCFVSDWKMLKNLSLVKYDISSAKLYLKSFMLEATMENTCLIGQNCASWWPGIGRFKDYWAHGGWPCSSGFICVANVCVPHVYRRTPWGVKRLMSTQNVYCMCTQGTPKV